MKKQLLTVIALGSLINVQATDEITTAAVAAIGAQDAALGARAAAQAAQAAAQGAQVAAQGAEVAAKGSLKAVNQLSQLVTQAPQQVVKQTILQQIQEVGFSQYAKNTAQKFVNSEAFPYLCCAAAALVLEPVVTGTVRWAQRKWVGERPIQPNLIPVIELRNASPQHAFESISTKQQQITRRQYDAAALQDALHTTNNALNELLLVCEKIDTRRAGIRIDIAENRDRITYLRTRITEITDAYNAVLAARPVNLIAVTTARNTYIEEGVIILGNSNREAHQLCLISNRFDRNTQAQLFPAPVAPRTSFFIPSEMTKRRIYTMGLAGVFCAGYKFITS